MLPTIFISHGSPDLAITPNRAHDLLKQLGKELEKPRGILIISAHWNTTYPTIGGAPKPKTIHDFIGFPSELYRMNYPAQGFPELAHRVHNLLTASGFSSEIHPNRGFDHGVWNPLILMYANADIPITQLSIQPRHDPLYHFQFGQAIAPLRNDGILIIASGSATYNLWEIGRYDQPPSWVLGDFQK